MGIPASLGIGSGLNLGGLLHNLAQAEQQRLVPLRRLERSYETKLSAYGQLESALEQLKSAAEALGKSSLYRSVTVSSDAESFTASVTSESVPGRYRIDVNQLARAQSLVTDGVASKTDTIGDGATITLKLGDGNGNISSSVTLDIGAAESTLAGIRDAINAADIGITAAIIDDGSATPYRLTLTSKKTGTESQISVEVSGSGTPLDNLLSYDSQAGAGALTQTVAAANADLTINGIDIDSQSNVVEGAIQGVTLTLSKVTGTPETLVVTRDTEAIKNAFEEFVAAYNNLEAVQSKLTAYNGANAQNGVLLGDFTARTVENRVWRALSTPIEGGQYFGLAQIGIAIQSDGTMEIDAKKLEKALTTNMADVRALLAGTGTTKGLSKILTGTLKELVGDNGVLAIASNGLETSIDNVHERMKEMQERIDATIARYRFQFRQLDLIMAKLNSTQSYLSRQFAALSGGQQ